MTEAPGRARFLMVVWELTLRCNLACGHCGSRAGRPRANELTTGEALDVVRARDELTPADLPLDEQSRIVLARRLVREGLLRVVASGA